MKVPRNIVDRRLFQVALLYVGAAWLGIEITDFVVEQYGFSTKILDTVVLLAILGFPAFLIIGWFHGEEGHQEVQRVEVWLLLTLASLGAIGTYRIATATEDYTTPPAVAHGDVAPEEEPAPGSLGRRSIAVLPFRNNVADAELEWLGPGLADLLTTNLAQIPGLVLVGRQALFDLMQREGVPEHENIPESLALATAREAGARLLLWGSVTGTADDLRIDAQLSDLGGGTIVAAEFVRGEEVFTLVDSLSALLTADLTGTMRPPGNTRFRDLGTRNLGALAAFQRGTAAMRAGNPQEAERHYQEAAELDSAFVLPWLVSRSRDPSEARNEKSLERARFILRRLPEHLQEELAGIVPEELPAVLDSVFRSSADAIRLLSDRNR